MALLDFQTSLGRLIRVSDGYDSPGYRTLTEGERSCLAILAGSPGFRFTVKVQRSWCAGRSAKAAYLTLSVLPDGTRRRLLDEWTNSGGGTLSFIGAESAAFLDFIGQRLVKPSHEFTICQLELAALRAAEGADHFKPPDLPRLNCPQCAIRQGRYAGLVRFHAEPNHVLSALVNQEPLPPLSLDFTTLLFGPGLEGLYRTASPQEATLYEKLALPVASTVLFRGGHRRETIESLLEAGAVEYAD
jgi:hypothetical protein